MNNPIEEVMNTQSVFGGNYDYLQEIQQHSKEDLAKCLKIAERLEALNRSKIARMTAVRYEIAVGLYVVNKERLYAGSFESIYHFSNKVLGFKKVTTSMYIKVAKTLLRHDKPVNIWDNTDYGITQLYEMSKIPVEDLNNFIKDGSVKPTMTIDELQTFVRAYKQGKLQAKRDAEALAMLPINKANEEFHAAYNILKEHLVKSGDQEAAYKLLPVLMDAVVDLYNAKKGADLPVR